ncbi:hypothetical protein V5799_029916, partial [Amblyomma americanum]
MECEPNPDPTYTLKHDPREGYHRRGRRYRRDLSGVKEVGGGALDQRPTSRRGVSVVSSLPLDGDDGCSANEFAPPRFSSAQRAGGGSVVGMDSAVAEDAFPSSAAPHPTANISLGGLRGRLYAAVACAALYHVYLLFALWREWAHGPDMCRPVWLLALATAGVHVMVVGRTVMARFSHSIIASMDALGYNE